MGVLVSPGVTQKLASLLLAAFFAGLGGSGFGLGFHEEKEETMSWMPILRLSVLQVKGNMLTRVKLQRGDHRAIDMAHIASRGGPPMVVKPSRRDAPHSLSNSHRS